ncbi:MAG: Fe-S-containing protein [Acidobacteriota bacterium]
MAKVRPIHAAVIVLLFGAGVLVADYALDGGFRQAGYQRVSPDPKGQIVLDIAELTSTEARFYRFLNAGNQEVKFFVARDPAGVVQVAFDANAICYKTQRGYRYEGEWVACNKCDKSFRIAEVNDGGGGCKPVPLAHQVIGDQLVLQENDILTGWRYFR